MYEVVGRAAPIVTERDLADDRERTVARVREAVVGPGQGALW
jgi:hypothetical protein